MGRFTDPTLVELARNTKEEYEVIREMFLGNELYWEDHIVDHVKNVKLIDLI